jgi:ATPase subunit of ABC transporter with duplicated ATPase domains
LENAIAEFPGCLVLTAYDSWFLDRLSTHIVAWEGTKTLLHSGIRSREILLASRLNKISRLGAEAAALIE